MSQPQTPKFPWAVLPSGRIINLSAVVSATPQKSEDTNILHVTLSQAGRQETYQGDDALQLLNLMIELSAFVAKPPDDGLGIKRAGGIVIAKEV